MSGISLICVTRTIKEKPQGSAYRGATRHLCSFGFLADKLRPPNMDAYSSTLHHYIVDVIREEMP